MEQLERTRRYLKRLRDIYREVPYTPDTREYYVDDAYSFFVHCYHIRDWLVVLGRGATTTKDVNAFINSHLELRICAGLCNGTKHCRLTRSMRTDRQPDIASRRFVSSGIGDDLRTTQGKFTVISDAKFYDALELAETCMRLWDDYIAHMKG